MDDLSGKISSFLDDPNNMETIKSISGMFGGGGGDASRSEGGSNPLAGFDSDKMAKLTRIMEKTSTKDDKRVNLLLALKPYLNDKRRTNMDSAMKIIKFAKLASIIGEGFDL